ncbi:MarR family transcriptional regulator [Thermophilibacter sp.]
MDLKEYMSVRRAYNIVRQQVAAKERLTFEELAIICHLCEADEPVKTSTIAEYQGALRPTMTHRTNHLETLGLIERAEGTRDRRNVVCSVSDAGRERVAELAELTCEQIPTGRALSRTAPERILKYVDAMGAFFCKAGDLVLLGLLAADDEALTIMQLVDALGLLQPTVSMSVSTLAERGLVGRGHGSGSSHTTSVSLTDEGRGVAESLAESIAQIVVRRRPRTGSKEQ